MGFSTVSDHLLEGYIHQMPPVGGGMPWNRCWDALGIAGRIYSWSFSENCLASV